jgi:hypothetical protein
MVFVGVDGSMYFRCTIKTCLGRIRTDADYRGIEIRNNNRLEMWNVYDVDIRTNNSCEGWHNRFNRAVDRHHPNIWHLLGIIMEEQASTEVLRSQIAAGQDVLRQVPKYRNMQKKIETIRGRYRAGTIDVIQYLDGITFNLKG